MKKRRVIVDTVTGMTLCGILVAGIYAATSSRFTSFNTLPANADTAICSPDCAMLSVTPVGPGGDCDDVTCEQPSPVTGCTTVTVDPPCMWGNMCLAGYCIDACVDHIEPDCTEVPGMHPGHGESCSVMCKTLGEHTCETTFMPTGGCAVETDRCMAEPGTGLMKCLDPCQMFIDADMPSCSDIPLSNIAKDQQCKFSCYTRSSYGCTSTDQTGMCSQSPIPLHCDTFSSGLCIDPCEDFEEPFCSDVNPTRGLGEEERVTCKAYVNGTCNINMIGACAPGLIRDPAGTTCIENCAGSPTGCSSSSSSSPPMCCNLTTQTCQPI